MARILIAEDEVVIRDLYMELLTEEGHIVDTAGDGEQALLLAQKNEYDLILLDIMMPKMDGTAALRRIRRDSKNLKSKIVMLTVLTDEGHIEDTLTHGADGYLIKSALTPDQFVGEVKAFLKPAA